MTRGPYGGLSRARYHRTRDHLLALAQPSRLAVVSWKALVRQPLKTLTRAFPGLDRLRGARTIPSTLYLLTTHSVFQESGARSGPPQRLLSE